MRVLGPPLSKCLASSRAAGLETILSPLTDVFFEYPPFANSVMYAICAGIFVIVFIVRPPIPATLAAPAAPLKLGQHNSQDHTTPMSMPRGP